MTTIVGVVTYTGWTIAADYQVTSNDRPFVSTSQRKIITIGGYTYACAGKGSACDAAMFLWEPPDCEGVTDPHHFAVSTLAPSLRELFAEQRITFEDDEGFQMIIGFGGELFQIEGDMTVLVDASGLYAIGSGASYALGALASGATPRNAVLAASEFDIWTGGGVDEERWEVPHD
jgi:ATP-dependent protease HslVU (ClpYQ) peptidase subunit